MNKKKKKTLLISIGILIVAGAVTAIIFFTEPEAQRSGATKDTAMLVDVEEAVQGTFTPTIIATGSVRPSREIILSPRISGEIVKLSEGFVPGGIVDNGEVLLKIDPSDYLNALELRRSELSQALADLDIEQGRQDVAQKDYELVDDQLPKDINKDLVLREPQLNAVKARVEAARAGVNQAQLQLQRTTLKAPFDAQVITRNANVGSQVAPGDNLARLVGREIYWVVVSIPLSKLSQISFPNNENERGSEVKIIDSKAWKPGEYRIGYLYKLVGALEDQTRLARVLVAVPDPLGRLGDEVDLPPLVINSFVEVQIDGDQIANVVRVNRDYVRQDETIWLMENEQLKIKEVDILFQDSKYAYIADGVEDGDQIVTTNISTVTEGASLRINGADSTNINSGDTTGRISNRSTTSSGGASK